MVSLVRKLNLIVWSNALCILTVSIIIFLIFHLFVQMNNDDQQNPFFFTYYRHVWKWDYKPLGGGSGEKWDKKLENNALLNDLKWIRKQFGGSNNVCAIYYLDLAALGSGGEEIFLELLVPSPTLPMVLFLLVRV